MKNKLDILRADKIGDEFDTQYIFRCQPDVYQRLDDVKNTGGGLIMSIDFPAAYDVSDPFTSRLISLREMKHWELAPSGPARVAESGIDFTITSKGSGKDFLSNLRKAVEHGLSKEDALKALTSTPAKMVRADDKLGAVRQGYIANFLVTSGDIFSKNATIHENWNRGERYVIKPLDHVDISGKYTLSAKEAQYDLKVKGEPGKMKSSIELIGTNDEGEADTTHVSVKTIQNGNLITLTFTLEDDHFNGLVRLAGNVNMDSKIWDGRGEDPDGNWFDWVAVRQDSEQKEPAPEAKNDSIVPPSVGNVVYPFMAYGWEEAPESNTLLITNATVWTLEDEGVIDKGQVLIHNGKIAAVGQEIDLAAVFGKTPVTPAVIDAKGKHVTPGVIDEHSHIAATRGVNESGQASSAEVEVGSVINSEDINIYRQLAGGVTASQILHGSA
ncbi:MAG: amidohydrolase family protein, partial [Flavobacteriales bacterium]|nr:amidohydrolase family protein [Flavobacteriales bacterium]